MKLVKIIAGKSSGKLERLTDFQARALVDAHLAVFVKTKGKEKK